MDNFLANCPICGFHDKDPFQVILHVGTEHSITSSLLDGAFHDEPPPPKTRSSRPRERKSNRSAQIEPRQEKQTPERKTEKPRKDHVRPQARSVRPTPTQPARARQVALNPVQVARSPPSNDESDSIDTTRALTESFRSELLKLQQTIETSSEKQPALAECYICSQLVHLAEYNEHIDVHNQASVASPTSAGSPSSSPPSRSPRSSQSSRSSIDSSPRTPVSYNHDSSSTIVSTRQPQDPKSGRPPSTYADRSVELGPYCDEKRMPTWLLDQHWNGPPVKKINTVDRHGRVVTRLICENQASGVIDLLTRVVSKCDDTDKVYLCHPSVKHVHRMARDGPFCGYFNIQMIISYLQATQPVANALFQNGLPTILDLQVMIEEAWDQGFSEVGREETGGIIGTRKWIGTPEVEALFHCKGYRCQNTIFRRTRQDPRFAHEQLLDFVEVYFRDGKAERKSRARVTDKPPLYLQQPGHSMTITGLEVLKDGTRNLLVFNPSFGPTSRMRSLLDGTSRRSVSSRSAERMMQIYRRSPEQLARYEDFEIVQVTMPTWVYPRHTIPDRNKFLLSINDTT